jgi:hypothetical protein
MRTTTISTLPILAPTSFPHDRRNGFVPPTRLLHPLAGRHPSPSRPTRMIAAMAASSE